MTECLVKSQLLHLKKTKQNNDVQYKKIKGKTTTWGVPLRLHSGFQQTSARVHPVDRLARDALLEGRQEGPPLPLDLRLRAGPGLTERDGRLQERGAVEGAALGEGGTRYPINELDPMEQKTGIDQRFEPLGTHPCPSFARQTLTSKVTLAMGRSRAPTMSSATSSLEGEAILVGIESTITL